MIRRGEIYWINLDPVIGSEIAKTRPGLVISNDLNNEVSDTITVLPITSNTQKTYPFEVLLPKSSSKLPNDSKVKSNQIRTVDKRRLGKLLGSVESDLLEKVENALKIHLDLK